MNRPPSSTSVLSVRVSVRERAVLAAAAEGEHTSVSEFIRRNALVSAEIAVMDRRAVTIPAEAWKRFEEWAARPARAVRGVTNLLSRKPTWEQ